MNKPRITTEERLNAARPVLSREKSESLWLQIEGNIHGISREAKAPREVERLIVSPYGAFLHTKIGLSVTVMLLLVVSTTSVALASEPARPGDLLFPIDRAIEDIRVTLARTDDSRNELLRKIGDERLNELRSIIGEETEDRKHDDSGVFIGSEELRTLQIEADIFTDSTVIKVEVNGTKSYLTTQGRTEEEIVSAILSRYAFLSGEVVRDAVRLQREDRASRPQDRGEVALRESGRGRVDEALKIALPQLSEGSLDGDELIRRLEEELRGLDVEIDDAFRIRDGEIRYEKRDDTEDEGDEVDNSRIEIREGDERIRIEEKDGEVRVRISEEREEEGDDDEREEKQADTVDSERDENERDEPERERGVNEDDDDSRGKGNGGTEDEDKNTIEDEDENEEEIEKVENEHDDEDSEDDRYQ